MQSILKISIRSITKKYHTSNYNLKKIIENVPVLGESITEGSIASWNKNEGDIVAIDDVIVIVETDKVTVDIKSTHAGILTKKIAVDTVIVGNPLYEIDVSSNEIKSPSIKIQQTNVLTNNTTSNHDTNLKAHVPLIKFTGKRDHSKKDILNIKKNTTQTQEIKQLPTTNAIKSNTNNNNNNNNKIMKESTGVLYTTLKDKGFYGRPKFTLKEIEAIESGGATL